MPISVSVTFFRSPSLRASRHRGRGVRRGEGTRSMSRFVLFLLAVLAASPATAQVKCTDSMETLERDADSRMSAQDFIKDVETNEAVFAKAFASYGYRLEVSVQTLLGETVDGEYRRTST